FYSLHPLTQNSLYTGVAMFDIVKRRYWYFALSLLVIVPGIIALLVWKLPLSIDFTSGTLLELQFNQTTQPLEPARLRQVYAEKNFPDSTVQTSGGNVAIIRSKPLGEADQRAII